MARATNRDTSLDTNCLLRWVLQDLPEQASAIDRLLAGPTTCHVADMALLEFVFALEKLYGCPRGVIADNLIAIATHPSINCNKPLLDRCLPWYTANPSLSFVDCCLTAYAELNDAAPLLTFDRALAKKLPHAELLEV